MPQGAEVEEFKETTDRDTRIIRVHVGRRSFDPWRLLDEPAATDTPIFVWSDGRSGMRFAAMGSVEQVELHGPERFERAEMLISRWRELLDDVEVPSHLPLAHAGFAFWDTVTADGAWQGWPAARVSLPRALAWSRGGHGGVVVAGRRAHGEAPGATVARFRRIAAGLCAANPGDGVGGSGPDTGEAGLARSAWCRCVTDATRAIAGGVMDKVVLARSAAVATSARIPALLRELSSANPSAYAFCVGSPQTGYFVGATPETLTRVRGATVETVALAGTAQRGQTPAEDAGCRVALVGSGKDQREHAITLRAIREALEPVCDELHVDSEASLVALPHVLHLETSIRGRLKPGVGALAVAGRLHPTPAVGGWPRTPALKWLRDNEPLDRGWYAGPIGWVGRDGDGVFAVAIRSALLRGEGAHLFAGAGIVAGSDPEREWDETRLKLLTARDVLAENGGPS
jgi:salicylate biosynthesis isochorismate synthase